MLLPDALSFQSTVYPYGSAIPRLDPLYLALDVNIVH